jgi:hypothetical protein
MGSDEAAMLRLWREKRGEICYFFARRRFEVEKLVEAA